MLLLSPALSGLGDGIRLAHLLVRVLREQTDAIGILARRYGRCIHNRHRLIGMQGRKTGFRRIPGEVVEELWRRWNVRINGNHIGIPNRGSRKEFCVCMNCVSADI